MFYLLKRTFLGVCALLISKNSFYLLFEVYLLFIFFESFFKLDFQASDNVYSSNKLFLLPFDGSVFL